MQHFYLIMRLQLTWSGSWDSGSSSLCCLCCVVRGYCSWCGGGLGSGWSSCNLYQSAVLHIAKQPRSLQKQIAKVNDISV